MAKFRFSLQPKLDERMARRDSLALALERSRAERRDAASRLREAEEELAEAAQRFRAATDNLLSPNRGTRAAADLIARNRFRDDLRRHRADLESGRDAIRAEIRTIDARIAETERELARVLDEVTTFERLCERQLDAFRKDAARAQEKARDDDAILRWKRPDE